MKAKVNSTYPRGTLGWIGRVGRMLESPWSGQVDRVGRVRSSEPQRICSSRSVCSSGPAIRSGERTGVGTVGRVGRVSRIGRVGRFFGSCLKHASAVYRGHGHGSQRQPRSGARSQLQRNYVNVNAFNVTFHHSHDLNVNVNG